MATVTFDHVTKKFGDVFAVNSLSLQVKDEEFLVLVGPSGCGKTTALRMIAGLEEQTSGDIFIGERLVNDVAPKDRDIAMVFQNYALYPHMSVYDNIAFGLKLRGMPKTEIERRVTEVGEMLGLQKLLKRKPKELSGGQRQRVAVGRAIAREPAVFLMDEPLSNLDAALRIETRAQLQKLHQRIRRTTVYVTHDQVEAMTLGDRIVVLADGRIQQIGRPIELYRSPVNRFVAGFIGTPAMNFLEGTLAADGGRMYFSAEGARLKMRAGTAIFESSEPITLGIRPEDLRMDLIAQQPAHGPADGDTLAGRVVLVERLGGTSHVHFQVGPHRLMASVASDSLPEVGADITARVPAARVHLFGGDGRAISAKP